MGLVPRECLEEPFSEEGCVEKQSMVENPKGVLYKGARLRPLALPMVTVGSQIILKMNVGVKQESVCIVEVQHIECPVVQLCPKEEK